MQRSATGLTKGRWLKLVVGLAGLAVIAGLYGIDRILERLPPAIARALDESVADLSRASQAFAEDAEPTNGVGDTAPASTASVLPAKVSIVRYLDGYDTDERYVGRVVSRRSSDLGFERLGRIATILVDEGETVEAGQPLARLETDLLTAHKHMLLSQLAHSRAEHREAEAGLKLARATQGRRQELARANNVSRQLYDEAMAEETAAEARAEAARARIAEVQSSIAKTDLEISLSTLRAPFDGIVVGRFGDEGTTFNAGTPVLRLVEAGVLEVRAGIPPDAAETLELGKRYTIEIAGDVHEAPLAAVLPELDARTRSIPVMFRLADGVDVQAGQIARIIVRRRVPLRGFWIPITGLVEGRRGLWNAYAVEDSKEGDGLLRLTSRELTLIYNNAQEAFVTGTVADGERLVTTGLHRLVPGQLVRVQ